MDVIKSVFGLVEVYGNRFVNVVFNRRGTENNIDKSVPIHFNQPKHTLNDVQVIPLLHVNSNRDNIRFSMEQHLTDKAGTLQNGINRTCDH